MRKLAALFALARATRMAAVYTLPGMAEVQVQKDLVYKEGGRTWHKLDVYHPPSTPNKPAYPAVILVHGGAKASSNMKNTRPFVSWGQLFAASGISAITFNWDYPEGVQIVALIEYVRKNAEQLNVDKDRLCIFAFSGGVEIAVPAVMKGTPEYVRCIVAYYGNLKRAQTQLEEETATKLVPMLIVKAAQDEFIPAGSIDRFVEMAQAKGAEVQLLTHSKGGHAFDLRNDDDQSHEIIKRTLEFVKERLETP